MRLPGRDDARHVAFGVSHTAHVVAFDAHFLGRLRSAVERRHAALMDTAGLNQGVFDALVLLAAGSWEPAAVRRGWDAVQQPQARMHENRLRRLAFIGFPDDETAELSALHTRNFMRGAVRWAARVRAAAVCAATPSPPCPPGSRRRARDRHRRAPRPRQVLEADPFDAPEVPAPTAAGVRLLAVPLLELLGQQGTARRVGVQCSSVRPTPPLVR